MRKRITFLSSLAIAAVLSLPMQARADDPAPETVVATVNGTDITIGHMILAATSLPQQYQQLPAATLYDAILDQLIQQETLRQSNTAELPAHIGLALENEERSLIAGHALEQVMADAATEAEIEAVYNDQYANGSGAQEFNASHILVETEEEANAIVEELAGGADFPALAAEKSTGPSGPNGGSLGWFGKGMMVPAFEEAVIALEKGEVSAPVQTQFGWHVIILNDERTAEAPTLEEVREEIAGNLRRDAVTAHVDDLVGAATVDRPEVSVDPEVIRNIDLLLK